MGFLNEEVESSGLGKLVYFEKLEREGLEGLMLMPFI
jgi:hypothetical protein